MVAQVSPVGRDWPLENPNIIHGLNSGIVYIDKSHRCIVYNELAAQLLGTTVPFGQPVTIDSILPPDGEEYRTLVALVNSNREIKDQIVTWSSAGRIRHVLMDSYFRRNADGGTDGVYVVMKDLGDFSLLEQHLQRTDKLATVGKIAAGIAHEIRNPLTTLKGFLQMMERRLDERNLQEETNYTRVMLSEVNRVDALVSELLLLSKPHSIEMTISHVGQLMAELGPLIESQTLLHGIEYTCVIDGDMVVVADIPMMKQVILNLVKNAVESMESGGALKIHAYATDTHIHIDVSDTGPGIPYYQMDKIFDAFYTTKEKGTGLGLPICQRIVAEHGGEIRVSSKGFGATFSVLLPTPQCAG